MRGLQIVGVTLTAFALFLLVDLSFGQRGMSRRPTVSAETKAEKQKLWNAIPLEIQFADPALFVTEDDDEGGAGMKVDWAKYISPQTIEKEIAMIATEAQDDVKNPGFFKSRGFDDAFQHHSILAFMFHIAANHPGDIAWKDKAAGLRDMAHEAAMKSLEQADNAFDLAKQSTDIANKLVSGGFKGNVEPPKPGKKEALALADEVFDFTALMKRLETAQRRRMRPWTKDANEFNAHLDGMLHESEVGAAMAAGMLHKSYALAGEGDYIGWSTKMRDNLVAATAATKEKNFDKATTVVRDVNLQCSDCHTAYR